VIWTAALKALSQSYPHAEIEVLTYASNAAVFEQLPFVRKVHGLKSHGKWELVRTLWSLRSRSYDWLLGFHATTSLCRWAFLAKAEKMVLHHHSWNYTPRGSQPVPFAGQLESALLRDQRVLEAMGAKVPSSATALVFTAEEQAEAEREMQAAIQACGGDVQKPRYLFLPGASHHLRRYPKELWWREVLKVRDQGRYQPVVLVDRTLVQEWSLKDMSLTERIPLLHGGGLRGFMALIRRGARAFANDSGPGHISVACGLPTAFVFGPGCAGDWHAYDRSKNPLLRARVDCRSDGPRDQEMFQFCTVDSCSHHRCMREIQIEGIYG
jgi:ADP-heptose:LPS heptosyltransferase